MAKQVASTLKKILDDPVMKIIRNKEADIQPAVQTCRDYWSYDLYTRKPGAAYQEEVFVGTDLDLICVLFALVDRGAVIKIPQYKSIRTRTQRTDQMLVSKENRHGKLLGITSNQNTFVFSVMVKDMNVMTTDSVGDFRNFAITDFDGKWYDGWETLEFLPTAKENDFLKDKSLYSGNSIAFKNFVHPNRWISIYGQYYLKTKALIERLRDENQWLYQRRKELEALGITAPEGYLVASEVPVKTPGKKIKVAAFEVELDLPPLEAEYNCHKIEATQESWLHVYETRKRNMKNVSALQAMTRATELAFVLHGGFKRLPGWIKEASWEQGYKQKGKRKEWTRLVLGQPKVGQTGIALRARTWEKTEEVSEYYQP